MIRHSVWIVTMLSVLTSCSDPPENKVNRGNTLSPEPAAVAPSSPPSLIYASGWEGITMIASGAKINIDTAGHFTTSRNACFREESGAISFDDWNTIARILNLAMSEGLQKEPTCIPVTDAIAKMDGIAEVILPNHQKQMLFEARYFETCSTISNPKLSLELLEAICRIVITSEREECPPITSNLSLLMEDSSLMRR